MKSYGMISTYYDKLNSFDPKAYAEELDEKLKDMGIGQGEMLLDLACGTGRISCALQNLGYDVTGVDLSCDMLEQARENAERECSVPPLFLNQDMRSLDLYGTYRAVVCCSDSLNYLTDNASLEAAFASVSLFTEKDGVFLFDLNTKHRFENIYADNAYVLECEDALLAWQNEYNKKTRICRFYLSLFIEENGLYRRYDEIQKEKYHPEKTVDALLCRHGFEIASKRYGEDGEKVYYVCIKK